MEDTRFKVIKLFAYVVTIIHQIVSFFFIFGVMWLVNLLFKEDINIWLVTFIVYTIFIVKNYTEIIVNSTLKEIKNNEDL